jgi:hypothetical protein
MRKLKVAVGLVLFLGLMAAGCAAGSSPSSSPSSSSSAEAAPVPGTAPECKVDSDCACGTDVTTHKCAFGPASRIDASRQCPDFCTGIAGRMKIACVEGSCRQVKR